MNKLNMLFSTSENGNKIDDFDIIDLIDKQDWETLNHLVVCEDLNGKVTARFEQDVWDLLPYSKSKAKRYLNFTEWNDTPELQLELKTLVFGWLYNKSVIGIAVKFSTVEQRLYKIKAAYRFLKEVNAKSLSYLANTAHFEDFKLDLVRQNYSQRSLELIFVAINKATELEPWLRASFGFAKKLEAVSLAKNMSERTLQQTLVIPERLADVIYGKAIKLVEDAFMYKELIASTEFQLQKNYDAAKKILDTKIQNGAKLTCVNRKGEVVDQRKYITAIADYLPREVSSIISPLTNLIPDVKIRNGHDFQRYYGQLITASYIVCGAFSGMRDSELEKLSSNSYYKDSFNKRDFHFLQSGTFKLGEKRETWITAPVAKVAIQLASELTKIWREQIDYPHPDYQNTLWCNQILRSKKPCLITTWPGRLKRFCKHFDLVVTDEDYKECIQSNPNSTNKIKTSVIIGQPWPLSTHQFRRSLAYYTIKHRLGTKVAIKQQFKHLRLAMTEWYTNGGQLASLLDLSVDKKVQQALDAASNEMVAKKIFQQWHSDESLSGSFGKAIVKMRDDIPHVYSSWETIYEAVKKGLLTLHGTAHSYCKNGYNCDMDGIVMPQFCVDCSSQGSIIDEEQAKWWQRKHVSLLNYLKSEEDISVTEKSHFITQIRAAESVMSDFNMPFEPFAFEPDLRIKNT
ncbi:hypothetical protein [Pseudoalteromonas 'SMAR']|uniref:hypothetical protein n=1 Tax=Pseudoalteromonas 'SMAR' TaxID=3416908 RepID=UPI003AF27209